MTLNTPTLQPWDAYLCLNNRAPYRHTRDSELSGRCAHTFNSSQSHVTLGRQKKERDRNESRGSVTVERSHFGMGRSHLINTVKYSHLTQCLLKAAQTIMALLEGSYDYEFQGRWSWSQVFWNNWKKFNQNLRQIWSQTRNTYNLMTSPRTPHTVC